MQECYCCKCDLKYWTPKTEKAIEKCPFCEMSNNSDKNQANNLDVIDKMRILDIIVAEDRNDYG
ncbi:hypothetical protein [Selenihalanaerobacter shriftii]|uniref:Uncharacterized protein n=1 Tax=Selenihalanaerobacter shriftii TaxID=142842 RepID=A0A1T4PHG1_9FIRM|nr:hypothetical protein [Selenihalanaerobacter shriftii]SJZ90952.1 hypothetical protein SAMN02745118_02164 [Selenihalanaerobacter shriftii]